MRGEGVRVVTSLEVGLVLLSHLHKVQAWVENDAEDRSGDSRVRDA